MSKTLGNSWPLLNVYLRDRKDIADGNVQLIDRGSRRFVVTFSERRIWPSEFAFTGRHHIIIKLCLICLFSQLLTVFSFNAPGATRIIIFRATVAWLINRKIYEICACFPTWDRCVICQKWNPYSVHHFENPAVTNRNHLQWCAESCTSFTNHIFILRNSTIHGAMFVITLFIPIRPIFPWH